MTFDAVGAAWFVLETSSRALAVALAVALVLRLLRVRAVSVLHSAWSAVLVAMFLMPVLPSIVPALPLAMPATADDLFAATSGADQPSPTVPAGSMQARNGINATPVSLARESAQVNAQPGASDTGAPTSRSRFPLVLLVVYVAGVVLFLARLWHGWLVASAMAQRAIRRGPVRVDVGHPVYESPEVMVPMTVGALRPVIVLPAGWRTWDTETVAAIIAHEVTHVRRRDASFAFLAHLNRAWFWFHPLAWWLERKLAVTAEHACDEAAARAISAPSRYAEILVEMADVVRRNRGRLTWQAVGVNGAGHLDRRIDRLLRGDAFASASRGKKIATAIACVLAIATVSACRQQSSAEPLREDPELAKVLASQGEQSKQFEAARDMTQEQADALEDRLAQVPDDFDARRQLITYYRASRQVAWDKKVPGLRRHALWLIEHHPDHEVDAPALSPQYDPEGFAAARKLFAAHLANPDVSPFVVYRAATFFAPHDKPYAEELIRRGMTIDPDSAVLRARMPPQMAGYEWPRQLASLYAAAIRGSDSAWGTYNDLPTHVDRARSPYAMDVRRKLETTTDAALLAGVGSILTRPIPPQKDPTVTQALQEARALGVRYVERALELQPNLINAKATLVRMRLSEQATDADRLANRAHERYITAEDIAEFLKKDTVAAKQQRDEAKALAEQVLTIAAAHSQDPRYSAAIMTAHHVLATAALRDGDREGAVRHMRESVKVPASEQIQYAPPFSWGRPVTRLLKEGQHQAVAEFLEALARLTIIERDRLLKDAQAIREGRMPSSYQRAVAREGQ